MGLGVFGTSTAAGEVFLHSPLQIGCNAGIKGVVFASKKIGVKDNNSVLSQEGVWGGVSDFE